MEDKLPIGSSDTRLWTSEFRLHETQKAAVAATTQVSKRETFEHGEDFICVFIALKITISNKLHKNNKIKIKNLQEIALVFENSLNLRLPSENLCSGLHFSANSQPPQKMEKVIVNESPLGRGVFARVPIEQGETILFVAGKLIDFEASRRPGGEYSIQIGINSYVDPISPSRFLNHSCQPNAGLVDEIRLVALRQIVPNEEIRFDYSTSMLERDWELDCLCGSENCRRLIRDFDLLPASIQRHYLGLGVVQSFILEEIGAPVPVGSDPLALLIPR